MNLRKLAATTAALALAGTSLAACGSSNGGGSDSDVITASGSEPQSPLVSTNTNETGGGNVLDVLFRGLVRYDENGKSVNEVAQSITPNSDNTQFDIKLKDNWKFSDGTAVTADSFIKAWNYGAYSGNAQKQQDFYSPIKGFDEVSKENSTTKEMSGLEKVSDTEFKVTLSAPESSFPIRLGASAYYPLPDAFFKDPKGFGEHPIGNGPYKMDGQDAWQHNVEIRTVKNDDFSGDDKAQNGGVTFKLYSNLDTAYTDLQAGNLDVITQTVPPNAYATYRKDFPNSSTAKGIAVWSGFVIPGWESHFGNDEEGRLRRQAISMAINRDEIVSKIFNGTRIKAKDFTAPTLGETPNVPGNEVLNYNPEKAKELWKQADAIKPFSGDFEIAYNADGGHQEWVEAVTNNISSTLGISAKGKAYPVFKGLRDDVTNGTIQTAFRSSWQADYPSVANFLVPMYSTGGSSNDGKYSNTEYDNLLKEAASESDPAKASETYTKAQAILMKDLPSIPLWYNTASAAWNPDLKNVKYSWDGVPEFTEITRG